jgi:hypothetical protein
MSSAVEEVGYVTDVEGNYNYFQKYIHLSKVLSYADKEETILQFTGSNSLFVFGGDVCDKGPGSIRIARQLVALKKKYHDRVILIVGNRDINKLRWTSELDDSEMSNYESVPGPYWVKQDVRLSPKQYLTKLVEATDGVAPEHAVREVNTVVNRIKWILEATMGAQGDFDRRREELSSINKKPIEEISDEDVAQSYINSVKPNGEIFEYLFHGQLAYVHKETLFMHAGVNKDNIGYVPFTHERYVEISEWVNNLNKWYKDQLKDWQEHPYWSYQSKIKVPILRSLLSSKHDHRIHGVPKEEYEDEHRWRARGAHRLLDYVVPATVGSVIMTNMFNKMNNCTHCMPFSHQLSAC